MLPDLEDRAARRKFLIGLGVIALGALAIRIAYVLAIKHGEALVGDEPYYHSTGDDIANGFGFVTSHGPDGDPAATHPPLMPLFLALPSLFASGNSVFEQRFALALLGVITVIVIGLVGRSVAGSRVGLVASGIAALTPMLWTYDGELVSESLAGLLVALALWLAYRYLREPSVRTAVLLGIVCGLAMLTRAELALLAPLLAVPVLLVGTPAPSAQRVRRVAVAGAAALLVIAPWVGYNLSRFEKPVFISVSIGGALCGSNNDGAFYGPRIGLWVADDCPIPKKQPADPSVLADFWGDAGIDYLEDHVGRLPVVALARLGRVWGVYKPSATIDYQRRVDGIPTDLGWAGYASYLLLLPFGVAGVLVLRRRRVPVFPLLGPFAVVTLSAAAFYGLLRLRFVADIALVVLAAVAVDAALSAVSASRATAEDHQDV